MKKIKIMLTAVIVLGTVGGVLAFKAKRAGLYCTRSTVNGVCPTNAKCPNGLAGAVDVAGVKLCYTLTEDISGCNSNTACSATTRLLIEE